MSHVPMHLPLSQTAQQYRDFYKNWRKMPRGEGAIYFIGPKDISVSRVKIGFTMSTVRSRLAALQTGSPFEMTIYTYVNGRPAWEDLMHRYFADLRLHGEWFRLDGDLRDLVENCLAIKEDRGRDLNTGEFSQAFIDATIFRPVPPEVLLHRRSLLSAMSQAQR